MKPEKIARILVLILTVGVGIAALGYRFWNTAGAIEIHAAMPDKGGWLTSNINALAGESFTLQLVSDDVVHSFAIGQSDFEPVDVLPGQPTEVTLTFDEPGTYTFYCTRWCGANHWRMRGTITVTGDEPVDLDAPEPPLYLQLGIDLDQTHELHDLELTILPFAVRGAVLATQFQLIQSPNTQPIEVYRSQSPYDIYQDFRANATMADQIETQTWDLVAWNWQQNSDPAQLAEGKKLYQRDCAACHGVTGAGDGIFGAEKLPENDDHAEAESDGHPIEPPTNFQDPKHMLAASPALLQGKIIRGGMGTGMPSWGLIYTEAQTWAIVDYLYTFVFANPEE
jgi:mono/diheme cytochrome c family protein/plastocyanin